MTVGFDRAAAVIGAGSFGTALAAILSKAGHPVSLWVRRQEVAQEINERHTNSHYAPDATLPESLTATTDMGQAVRSSALVLLVVPSSAFRQTAREVGGHLSGDQLAVHATKGLEIASFRRMSEILREETCALKVGVLSGPNLAREILIGNPAGALIASHYEEVVAATQALFKGTTLRVYGARDVIGTEIAGAFKNIIAIAAGVVDGLGFGDNTRSLLVTRGLSEMAQLGVSLGADVFTFGGLAGIGDLMATATSKLSRNHQVGERLAKGETPEQIIETLGHVAEGVPTTEAVFRQITSTGLDLPIVTAVHGLLYEKKTPRDVLSRLMALPVGSELAALRYR